MKNFILLIVLAIISLSCNAQTPGAAYSVVERATFDNTAPCSVCTPWQFVQADSTLRRWDGTTWYTYVDPNAIGVGDNWGTQTVETNTTLVGDGTSGDPLGVNTSEVAMQSDLAGLGTDLSVSVTSTNATVVSSTGTNATIPAAQISAAGVMSAADKVKLDGLVGFSTQVISAGNLSIIIDYYGSTPMTFNINATGDYSIIVPATSRIDNIFIHGDNTTLNGGSFIFRIDNSANAEYERMISQLYNTATGSLVNVFSQGNNHTRGISGFIASDTYPNMSPYGGTGFDILYR